MRSIQIQFLFLVTIFATFSNAQLKPAMPTISHDRLFAARLEAQYVAPPGSSTGSGTGIFVLTTSDRRPVINYQLVYAGLLSPEVRSITVRNFGAGKNGEIVHTICGREREKCPSGVDGTIRDRWTEDGSPSGLAPNLLTELANRRLYVEIETAAGREIRSQLAASPFMVMAQEGTVELRGSGPTEGVSGIAALRLVRFPSHAELGVLLTVAGSREDPVSISFQGASERLRTLRMVAAPGTKPSRTLRTVSSKADSQALSDPQFAEALAAGKLTLVVHLGKEEKDTVQGNVVLVR